MQEQARRSFLTWLTGSIVAAGAAVGSWPFLRSLAPNVLYEPPKRMKLGDPGRFQEGVTYLEKQRDHYWREARKLEPESDRANELDKLAELIRQKENGILYLKGGDLQEELQESKLRYKIHHLPTFFDEEFFETKKVVYVPTQ